jgi:hypothetical protein
MKQMLYTASLERHMDTYFQGVRLDDYNQQYQLAQMRIVREGELMQLSQAEIQYKLAQLKTAMETNLKQTVLPKLIMDRTANTVNNIVENIAPVAIPKTMIPGLAEAIAKSKTMIPGLAEAIANPKLKKTPTKQPKFKEKSPMAIQIEEAKGSPSSIIAAKRRRESTPSTPGTPPFIDSPTSTTSSPSKIEKQIDILNKFKAREAARATTQPSSPPKDKKPTPIKYRRDMGVVNSMIRGLKLNRKISAETAGDLLAEVQNIKGTGASKKLNAFSSELMAKYDLDTGPEAFQAKRKDIYAALDAYSRDRKQLGQDVNPLLEIQKAKTMDDLNKIIDRHHLPVLRGSGLKSKSKVSKRKV